ncbi:MAG: DUF4249 family protein [Flavobacteriales bacterium]|nr:DUF4249 family protein [Flavobacteriales bacterium]
MKKTTFNTPKTNLLLLACLEMFIYSCTPKPIPIYLDEIESHPVVWTQVIPNTTTLLYLSRSFSALEFQESSTDTTDSTGTDGLEELMQQFLAEDALVILTHNNVNDTLFKVSDGIWATLSTELISGDTYQLFAQDFYNDKSITAEALMYPEVEPDSITYSIVDTATVDVMVQFIDPPGPNWYAVHFYSEYANPLEVDDPFAAENVVETELISDLEFNSSLVAISKTLEFLESDTFYVSLNNISPEYYDYLSQRQRGGTIYNQLVQEPINYVSNVQGGFGMFALHVPSVRQVILVD